MSIQSTNHYSKVNIDNMDKIQCHISFQGVIGAGKTVLFTEVREKMRNKYSNFIFVDEPVDEWSKKLYTDRKYEEEVGGEGGTITKKYFSMLDIFYEDMEKNGFMFQVNAFTSRVNNIVNAFNNHLKSSPPSAKSPQSMKILMYITRYVIIFFICLLVGLLITIISNKDRLGDGTLLLVCTVASLIVLVIHNDNEEEDKPLILLSERSLRSDRLFFKNLYESNTVRQVEWKTYNNFFTLICNHVMKKETIMVYIKVSPEKCFERIKRRNREVESNKKGGGISLEYLKELYNQHEELIDSFIKEDNKNSVIMIDNENDKTKEEMDNLVDHIIEKILHKVTS